MPVVHVTRRVHFNAAHRLHNPEKPDAWNAETFGRCNNPTWHGHNYVLEVTVAGEPDPETGYVIDLGRLKAILEARVLDKCDHRNLNLDVDFLEGILPSTENFVVAIWGEIEPAIRAEAPGARLHRVRLWETERNMAEYFGD